MKIENLKEFNALVKACRKLGVASIEVGELKITLSPSFDASWMQPVHLKDSAKTQPYSPDADVKVPTYDGPITDVEPPKTEELTDEQKMFWSAQGHEEVRQ